MRIAAAVLGVVGVARAAAAGTGPSAQDSAPPMEINEATVVVVELGFAGTVPSVANVLRQVQRRYEPEDGEGRTFAILDVDGEPTADRKLRLKIHLSSEKPGTGSLIFRPTGQVLWSRRIVLDREQAPSDRRARGLTVLLGDAAGKTRVVDATGATSILDARLARGRIPIRDLWPEGAVREVSFIYSACGCPVKVTCRRQGDRTPRTRELPVIFPDDRDALRVIDSLMGWALSDAAPR